MPSREPRPVPRSTARQDSWKSSRVGHRSRNGDVIASRCSGLLEIADDLDDAEHADDHGQEIEPVPQHGDAECVARGRRC